MTLPCTKIICFLSDLDGGGAQRTMVNIVNELAGDNELEVLFVVAHARGPAIKWVAGHVNLINLSCSRVKEALIPLSFIIRKNKPDVVFSTMLDANIVAVLAARLSGHNPKLIVRETNSQRARGDLGFFRKMLCRWAYRRSDSVIALSHGVAEEVRYDCRLSGDNLITIPNPVDIVKLKEQAEVSRNDIPPFVKDGPTIICIGRLTCQKGFDLLLTAFAKLEMHASLVLLGEGPDRDLLSSQAENLGISDRVLMPGFVESPADWLAHSDLFVLSSRWEGFGHVIVEAMACGLPVVATDCPHGPRDIISNNESGLLVPIEDPILLAGAIDKILKDKGLSERLSRSSLLRAKDFEVSHVAKIYKKCLLSNKG
ncbi:glycosyltransferase [Kiloniella majae]|uniref:glycosyltransferase n=1 Tax=Kiloniella majae TaxID=1938558 RepID=UPI000A279947|nr:glycosyltransferase [Kiloniella majae]